MTLQPRDVTRLRQTGDYHLMMAGSFTSKQAAPPDSHLTLLYQNWGME